MREIMIQYVIYDHPLDYPDHWVLRPWFLFPDGTVKPALGCILGDTLESVRYWVPRHCYNLGNTYEEDPKIYEVWI